MPNDTQRASAHSTATTEATAHAAEILSIYTPAPSITTAEADYIAATNASSEATLNTYKSGMRLISTLMLENKNREACQVAKHLNEKVHSNSDTFMLHRCLDRIVKKESARYLNQLLGKTQEVQA